MGEIEHAAYAIDQNIAARDQRVDRGKDHNIDRELHVDSTGKLRPAKKPGAS
jgi:hypothetical protein